MGDPNETTLAHIEELRAQLKVCLDEMPDKVGKDEESEVWEKFDELSDLLSDVTTETEYRKETRRKLYRSGLRGDALYLDGDS